MSEPRICEKGGKGLLLPLLGDDEQDWPNELRAVLYFILLSWCFLGVSIIADIFMAAIEAVTSKRRVCSLQSGQKVVLKVWNSTVANLTLMALGSSAPEILLSVIEILSNNYYSGDLGPSTIVGSAAFNLLVIIAVCVYVIPENEARTIRQLGPFLVTATASTFAYLWLVLILAVVSPDVVEVWEGILTFFFFPIVVVIAFLADIGKLGCGKHSDAHMEEVRRKARDAGFELTRREAKLLAANADDHHNAGKSRAQHRTDLARGIAVCKDQDLQVFFPCLNYAYSEDSETFLCEVAKAGSLAAESRVGLEIATRDGTMKSGVDYNHRHIFVEMQAEDDCDVIEISRPKLAAPVSENEEQFFELVIVRAVVLKKHMESEAFQLTLAEEIEQESAKPSSVLKPKAESSWTAKIMVDNSWGAIGTVGFANVEFDVTMGERDQPIELLVQRTGGSAGTVSCTYKTESNTAIEDFDYVPVQGQLVFEEGVLERTIQITLKGNKGWEGRESFYVVLDDGEAEALEDNVKVLDGRFSVCEVVLCHMGSPDGVANQVLKFLDHAINLDSVQAGNAHWKENLWQSLLPEDEDGDGVFTVSQLAVHVVAMPWKMLFALVPPPQYCGGWLCFFVALIAIGALTAIIGDCASLLGCVLDIEDAITAISIVALGTSLPDTFASKTAAVDDPSADNAIGNVTGSNAVNVFLGLGLPWMIAALYWEAHGATDEWRRKYPVQAKAWPHGAFVVLAGDLVYSVIIFTICGLSCLSVIMFRRKAFAAELGGPTGAKVMTSVFFVSLWIYYLLCASWKVKVGDVSEETMVGVAMMGYVMVLAFVMLLTLIKYGVDKYNHSANESFRNLLHKAAAEGREPTGPFDETIMDMRKQIGQLSKTLTWVENVARRGPQAGSERQKQVDAVQVGNFGMSGMSGMEGLRKTSDMDICESIQVRLSAPQWASTGSAGKLLDKE